MAARLVSESISGEQANELRKQAEQCDILLQSSAASVREKAATHEKLHRKIIILSNCGELIRCMETISLHNILLQNAYHIKFITDPPRWHSTLVNAILSNNPDNAEKTMREHVRRGYNMELLALKKTALPSEKDI